MSEEIKADHFKTMEDLLKHLKMWEEDDDYDAYYRFFCPRCAYEMAHKIEKQNELLSKKDKVIERTINLIKEKIEALRNEFEYKISHNEFGENYYIDSERYAFAEEALKEILEKAEKENE